MTPPAGFPSPVVDSILSALSEISASSESYSFDIPKRFSRYATRLHLLLNQFLRSLSENPSPAVHTALKGVAADLIQAQETLSVYRKKSKIYVLINCQSLCKSLQERAVGIGGWLALLDLEVVGNPDLRKKIGDLSKDMQQSVFKVTENEERVFCTLLKEGQGRETSKAVQSAIIMDLARALGTASDNHTELAEQVKLLKTDLTLSNSTSERRILMSLERICETCSICPNIAMGTVELNFEEDAHIPPFKNFLCPLTKEVMKDPVVLESSQTYERTAIQYWFDRCIEDGRDPTCPVTGQVLKNLEQKSNIGLAGAIEEWISRNVEIQVKSALQYLGEDCSYPVDSVERVLDNMYNISEEHPSRRYRIRNSGVVALIAKMLKNSSKSTGSGLRSKALLVLVSMAKDDESKQIMIDEGMTRLAKHSLTGSMEMEQENAVKLLVEFSRDEGYCTELASQKGALVLLSSMAGNIENPTLSNLAEEVLLNMEKVEENVQHLAAAGRFQPLLTRLCRGEEDVKIQMAALIGNMTLPSNGKELIARQGAKVLINMLLSKPEMKASSLRAMHNLSTLDDNASILVDFGAFPPLTNILFDQTLQDSSDLKELAASTIANIASRHGHWELAVADNEGHSLQSEFIIHKLLKLLPCVSSSCQVAVLRVLYGIVSSPQATESAATHIKTGEGIRTIIPFLGHSDSTNRLYAFRLTSLLSRKLAEPLANELRASNNLSLLKQTLMNSELPFGERSEAARILANLHLSDQEVKTICETSFIPWIVATLKDQRGNYSSRSMIEGLLGILLHFTKSPDPLLLNAVQENHLMIIFRDHLTFPSPRLKRRAALGLKYMSESSRFLVTAKDLEPQLPPGFCASLTFMCGKAPICTAACPVHGSACNEDSGFCLIRGQAVKPLVDILNDENRDVQIAAAEALSTLLLDPYSLKNSVEELEKLSVVDTVTNLFTEVRPGLLQERLVWMVERFLRVESRAQLSSVDQGLVKALVEAFKHGTPGAKRCAQDALTNLKQISGVSGRNSNINRGRRL